MDLKYQLVILILVFVIFLFSLKGLHLGTLFFFAIGGIFLYFFHHKLHLLFTKGSLKTTIIGTIVAMIVVFLAYGIFQVIENKKQINKDWPKYKCKPYVFPFAGWMVGPSSTSPTDTFIDCLWTYNKTFFDVLISPFVKILNLLVGIVKNQNEEIQSIRKMFAYIRSSSEDFAKDIYQKMHDAYSRIAYLFKTFLRVFQKLFDIFEDLFEVLTYTFYTTASIWNGPIGGIAHFFCFHGATPIELANGEIKFIKDVEIGDILQNNNRVISTMKFTANKTPMYRYQDVIISGNHMVKEDIWVCVKDSYNSFKLENYNKYIYCLETEKSRINIKGIEFTDYFGTHNETIQKIIYNFILKYLNEKKVIPFNEIKIDPDDKYYNSGFSPETPILMKGYPQKMIKDIEIGDETKEGKVLGIIKSKNTEMYNYRGNIVSGTNIIYEKETYMPVHRSKLAKKIESRESSEDYMYHMVTESGLVNTRYQIYRDFEQINNPHVEEYIDRYLESILNLL